MNVTLTIIFGVSIRSLYGYYKLAFAVSHFTIPLHHKADICLQCLLEGYRQKQHYLKGDKM